MPPEHHAHAGPRARPGGLPAPSPTARTRASSVAALPAPARQTEAPEEQRRGQHAREHCGLMRLAPAPELEDQLDDVHGCSPPSHRASGPPSAGRAGGARAAATSSPSGGPASGSS